MAFGTGTRGGVLIELPAGQPGRLAFIPSDVAERVTTLSAVTPIIGLKPPGFGLALAEGELATVLSLSAQVERPPHAEDAHVDRPSHAERAVLCRLAGTTVALIGGHIVATGAFDVDAAGQPLYRGEPVATLDVTALYAQAEAALWAARAVPGGAAQAEGSAAPPGAGRGTP